ncbi:uncharacterized protein LOC143038585 isoform X3 [Oratosquilla oratoria]|uniref:uncharacterized protein LOC143038585 isoform X3 n=1 Tax=Oratosquilla oratoria TaxID=337810 RepID=UPI003F76D15A
MAGHRQGGGGRTHWASRDRTTLPGYPTLLLVVLLPYVVYCVRHRPHLVGIAAVIYTFLVLPTALRGQLPSASAMWLPTAAKTAVAALWTRSLVHSGVLAHFLGALHSFVSWFVRTLALVASSLTSLVLGPPYFVAGVLLPSLHRFYLSTDGFRITSNQVVLFFMAERLFVPEARMTSLYFLLFYTVLAYLQKALCTRRWSPRLSDADMGEVVRVASLYVVTRLGKGVAMTFVIITFTTQVDRGEPDLAYIGVTIVYFVVTQRKWTGDERIVTWVRALALPWMEEEEDFWVPVIAKSLCVAASIALAAPLVLSQPILCAVAAYTNVLAPALLLHEHIEAHLRQNRGSLGNFVFASRQALLDNPTCPICLDAMRVARATPCGHLYHSACLRRCLTLSPLCPMCKRVLR